jgi:hypothetical protein
MDVHVRLSISMSQCRLVGLHNDTVSIYLGLDERIGGQWLLYWSTMSSLRPFWVLHSHVDVQPGSLARLAAAIRLSEFGNREHIHHTWLEILHLT